jgi:hypothetical protein
MHISAAMASDTKALLTLWLLKTGTTPAEIRTALQLAATSRLMAAEEQGFVRTAGAPIPPAHNVSQLHPSFDVEVLKAAREAELAAEAMNSDIKALITMSLLKIGTSSDEIHSALRLASRSRAAVAEIPSDGIPAGALPDGMPDAFAAATPKQVFRNEHLASLFNQGFVAA